MATRALNYYRRPSPLTVLLRGLGYCVAAAILIAATYVTAAIALGALPVNSSFVESADGVSIYVRTNGVHAELILPTRAANVDWSVEHPPAHMRALAEPLEWIAFGWGDLGFFANTPTWADLKLGTALTALSGLAPGAVHVEYLESPRAYKAREVKISADQYARLVTYIRASFKRDSAGRPDRADLPGYFSTDAFYDASGGYKFWYTCNDWVRKALSEAGVRTAVWSPFDTALFYQLERIRR